MCLRFEPISNSNLNRSSRRAAEAVFDHSSHYTSLIDAAWEAVQQASDSLSLGGEQDGDDMSLSVQMVGWATVFQWSGWGGGKKVLDCPEPVFNPRTLVLSPFPTSPSSILHNPQSDSFQPQRQSALHPVLSSIPDASPQHPCSALRLTPPGRQRHAFRRAGRWPRPRQAQQLRVGCQGNGLF